jgi:anti-sigma factor RsiW
MSAVDSRDDALLVALIDGELSAPERDAILARLVDEKALRDRLAALQETGVGMREAFAALNDEAPAERLQAILAGALAGAAASPRSEESSAPRRRPSIGAWLASLTPKIAVPVAAAFLAVGLIGGAIGYGLRAPAEPPQETWRQAVAEYWVLTTADTLALVPPPEVAKEQLAAAGARLGLPLTPEKIALDGPSFRGAQIFDFRGKPLTQIAYLDPDYGPIAYCVIADPSKPESPPAEDEMDGFSVVHWSGGGFGRMIIGRAPPERLRAFADQLIGQAGQGASSG